MDFFSVIMLLGGVALFLFGMDVMSAGLEKTAGSRLEIILRNVTSNRLKAFALGVGITSIIQSSSAVTVMLVGLVNSGIMKLHQTVGVIMGTNIGTTITAWIISLTGLTGESFIVRILNPNNFSMIFAVIGIICTMFSKKVKRRNAGEILLGFAVLMAGMAIMRSAISGLESNEAFRNIMVTFSNPLLGVLIGMVFTCIIQSSSAAVGILQTLSLTTSVTYATAIPVILGMKIGTCITALLASIGTNKNAKRVAAIHILFNVIEAIVFVAVLYILRSTVDLAFLNDTVSPVSIAIIHSLFSIATSILLFPFANQLEKLAKLAIKGRKGEETKYELLDERLFGTPVVALAQCSKLVIEMGIIARDSVLLALQMITKYDEKNAETIRENEESLDEYEDKLNTYLVKLSTHGLAGDESWKSSELLHVIGDLERMGDHALNILELAEEIRDNEISFTEIAMTDLVIAHSALVEIVNMAIDAFINGDDAAARHVEPLEEVIDNLTVKMRSRHIERLQKGECAIEPGIIWSDLLINYERVSDHCSNIAISVIQMGGESMDMHGYLNGIRSPENAEFGSMYNAYNEKYKLD
ncbi:MAG: Na/Pi cotransporter family protein [Oscillospiraceae bacterium]|nr:Na/Pi cotransporter family protein [Oscillospiraceae bacterium]